MMASVGSQSRSHADGAFLVIFVLACLLFWWLPSLLFRGVLDTEDPVTNASLLTSLMALVSFIFGYAIALPRVVLFQHFDLERLRTLAGRLTLLVFWPAVVVSVLFFQRRMAYEYGSGEGLSTIEQSVLYGHLFFGFLYLGLLERDVPRRQLLVALLTITLPRLIISMQWGRFFLAQALVPIIFLALARGWLRITWRLFGIMMLVSILILFGPALARGDSVFGSEEIVRFFANGSTMLLYQDNLDKTGNHCPPLLVALTAKTIPWSALQVCTIDIWGQRDLPATLDRLLAFDEIGDADSLTGPGSNYLLELFLTGGSPAIVIGSLLFGLACRTMVRSLVSPSLFSPIWIECLTRAALAPRSNLGYVFERVPSLLLSYLLFAVVITTWHHRTTPA